MVLLSTNDYLIVFNIIRLTDRATSHTGLFSLISFTYYI